MPSFYLYLFILSLFGVFLDQVTTGIGAMQGMYIAGDPGRFERNRLPRYFLRKFGPRIGPLAYFPVELAVVFGFPSVLYAAYTAYTPFLLEQFIFGELSFLQKLHHSLYIVGVSLLDS